MGNKPGPRRMSTKDVSRPDSKPRERSFNNNVMAILADKHPESAADYAIQLWYKANNHNPFFVCQEKSIDQNLEDAYLVINNVPYNVNIRTGKIVRA